LTAQLVSELFPIVQDQPSEIAIEALAATFWLTLAIVIDAPAGRAVVVERYIERLRGGLLPESADAPAPAPKGGC
jgi:hypothetical protein